MSHDIPDDKLRAVAPQSSSNLGRISPRAADLVTRAVADAIATARATERERVPERTRIGTHEFRDSQVRQLKKWAEALGRAWGREVGLDELVEVIESELAEHRDCLVGVPDRWVDDGEIMAACFPGAAGQPIRPINLSDAYALTWLYCEYCGLTELDLSDLLCLRTLMCGRNELQRLDLSDVFLLSYLACNDNRLADLDLIHVSGLKGLACSNNPLRKLDLSSVADLDQLTCDGTLLAELDLACVKSLSFLSCDAGLLEGVDLAAAKSLRKLCIRNHGKRLAFPVGARSITELSLSLAEPQLTELDLTNLPYLQWLWCPDSNITHLDLSPVPDLKVLACFGTQIRVLDVRGNHKLKHVSCGPNVEILKHAWQSIDVR